MSVWMFVCSCAFVLTGVLGCVCTWNESGDLLTSEPSPNIPRAPWSSHLDTPPRARDPRIDAGGVGERTTFQFGREVSGVIGTQVPFQTEWHTLGNPCS